MFGKRYVSVVLGSLFLFCAVSVFAADDEKSVISIESAQKTEYKKDVVTGSDSIVLTGGVRISVTRGSTKTTILADSVNYNRETDMIYAEGNVQLDQTGAKAGGEKVTAKSLLFNTSSLEGIFDNGRVVQTQSDAINLPSGSKLNVASTIFGRDSGGTIAFKNGELTFCDDEDPHWKIRARRIWLLPGGEFAFFSALLYVGHVPLFYFPAFYYPKDELIFNPAFGYRNREGYYVNTTTYLIGRKPQNAKSTAETNKAGTSSSASTDKIDFFSLMKTNGIKEQRREGLVMHNLDEDYKGDTSKYLKVMADYYANLGVMVGLDGVFKPNDIISSLEGKIQLGWSNTIFKNGKSYLPYGASGTRYADASNFMGMKTPFRYMGNFKMTLAKPFSLTLSMPMYSDPYFNYDFNNRAETMDWIDFLMSSPASNTEDASISEVTSFTWQTSGSYTFKIPEALSPYISSLSISSFSSSLVFSSLSNTTLSNTDSYSSYSPERKFYYPSQITPLKSSVKISGTLYQYPPVEKKSTTAKLSLTLQPPDEFSTEEKKDDKKDSKAEKTEEKKDGESEEEEQSQKSIFTEDALPSLGATVPSQTSLSGITYKLGYSVSPDFTSQLSYASTNLSAPEDFTWKNLQSTYYQAKAPTTLTSSLGYRESFISLSDTFSFDPVYQDHPYLNDDTTSGGYQASAIKTTRNSDFSARKLDLTNTNALTLRPLYYTKYFSETSLTWNTTLKMIRTKYISDDPEEPEWEFLTSDVTDEESLTTHNLNFVLAAKEGDFNQKLSLTTTLPPQVDKYTGVLSLGFPYTTFSIGTGIHRKSKTDDTWVKENISQSLAVSLFSSKLKLSQSWVYNTEESYHESLKFSASGYGVQFAYTMSYVTGYTFETDASGNRLGWKSTGEKEFQPYNISIAYTSPSKNFTYWSSRVAFAPSLSTSIVYDCVRPTYSYFKFVPSATFKINNFLNITFSAESRNNVIYRYFGFDREKYYGSDVETNVFKDLIDSFRFDDENKRKNSGFKLQNFSIKVTHELHDWNLSTEFTIKPRYVSDQGTPYYDFSPYISIGVVWRPMESMKTQVVDEYGEWKLNP